MKIRLLSSFSEWIAKRSSAKHIFFFTAASILISGAMQFLEQMTPVPAGQSLPLKMDFRPFSSAKDLNEVFQFYRETGRLLYFWQDVLDMFLPVAVGLMIGSFYSRTAVYWKLPISLNLLPFGFLVFDWIENSLMFYFLYSWPSVSESLALFAGRITAIKLMFVFIGYGMLFVCLLAFGFRFFKSRFSQSKE
ncbi:hypothetical protein JWG45_00540 [Leptospira sp. 201903070]|uniref:Uncharacterized protein n=1 Tax=Leptospira ainlahdjerensis TaxID=2810033 RepID=A0ABS2U8P9_9LEPT|nr:hypothetical protein [Leptospira ainlahdjerensis]MBM9575627.1 hypothetical protein [Leptospira ainlahdjerensis]